MLRFVPSLFPTARSDPQLYVARPVLLFAFYNALTWQITIGTPMVLFAQHLGASTFQVGLAYSFAYLLTPVQVLATALLPRFGYKKLTMGGWRTRTLFLLVPIVLAIMHPAQGNSVMVTALVLSVFGFCLFRSIGVAALTSWIYAIVPVSIRGRYFASEQLSSGTAGAVTLVLSALLFVALPFYPAILTQYLVALGGSAVSYYALTRFPDGRPNEEISLSTIVFETPRHLFASGAFRRFLWLSALWAVLTTPIPPFAAYYLKVVPRLSSGQIMLFEVVRYLGMVLGAWGIRHLIDASGTKFFFHAALAGLILVLLYWCCFLRSGWGGIPGLFTAYGVLGISLVCWLVASANFLPTVMPDGGSALMVAVYGAATAFIGGIAPVIWGPFLRSVGLDGSASLNAHVFQVFFICELLCATFLAVIIFRQSDGRPNGPAIKPNLA